MEYGYRKKLKISFGEAVDKVRKVLGDEGFGVITEINVKEKLKEKLGVEYGNYIILGACNPKYAYLALECEKEIGLMLPCNVIVYESEGVVVSSILPLAAMSMIENGKLKEIAMEVEGKLKKAIDSL